MILLGSIIYFMRLKQAGSETSTLTSESSQKETETLPLPEKKETETKVLFIHVAGAVKSPGVYKLKEGSRVFDAINAAGGYALNADPNALNLATPLTDGEKVYLPTLGEVPHQAASSSLPGGTSSSTSKININTADAQQLESLPGIGPAFAQRIIDYRTSQGRFSNIEDIENVSGIGKKRFEQLKDLITVN